MKKTNTRKFVVALGVASMLLLGNCQKSKTETTVHPKDSEETEILNRIKAGIAEVSSQTHVTTNTTQGRLPSDYPGYVTNPYNNAGFEHNNYLEFIKSQPDFNPNHDIDANTQLFNRLRAARGIAPQTKDVLIAAMKDIVYKLYTKTGNTVKYNTAIFDTYDLTPFEKDVYKLYFSTMNDNQTAVDTRIALSKSIELNIVNSTNTSILSDESKKRMLGMFSVYRYSTYYWNVVNPTPPNVNYMTPIGDAVDCAVFNYLDVSIFSAGATGNSVISGEASFYADLVYSLFFN
jgi:hypothetical protein